MRVLAVTLTLSVAMPAIIASAKEIWVSGWIYDAGTGRRVYGSTLVAVNRDSGETLATKVDSAPSAEAILQYGDEPLSFSVWGNDTMKVRLNVTLKGYKPDVVDLSYPEDFDGSWLRDTIWMVPDSCALDAKALIRLREVTVTATKLKMVMNGDTIVYNADAFNLSTGSMLDALVAQLPGVELNSHGQIKVNGEYVSSLLVDGKEFFNGDPNVALRNLPAYTVKKVNVYRRDITEGYDVAAVDKKELPLVMDVRLKPQYQKGFIGNVAAGYGLPDNRYMGRMFGMEYARSGRVTGFAQTNNINSESSGPGVNSAAGWSDVVASKGLHKIFKGGADFSWSNRYQLKEGARKTDFSVSGNAIYTRSEDWLASYVAAEMFMPQGSTYKNSLTESETRKHDVRSRFNWGFWGLPLSGSTALSLFANSGFSFVNGRGSGDSGAVGYGAVDPDCRTHHDTIYRSSTGTLGLSRRYAASTSLNFIVYRDRPPALLNEGTEVSHNIYLDWDYEHSKANGRTDREIIYTLPGNNLRQRQYDNDFYRNWHISPAWRTAIGFRRAHNRLWCLQITPRYTYRHSRGLRRMYESDNPFQSIEDAVLDIVNSYYSTETENEGAIKAVLSHEKGQSYARLTLDGRMVHTHLIYQREAIDADVSRLRWSWRPAFSAKYEHDGRRARHVYRLDATVSRHLPSLTSLLEFTDNSNPLAVFRGNPGLKPSTTLSVSASYENAADAKGRNIKLALSHEYYRDRKSQFRSYDPETGVSTYCPVNVSGAYTLGATVDVTAKLDRDNRWWLTSNTAAGYEHIPDWMDDGTAAPVLSTVRNVMLSEVIRVNWTVAEGYTLTACVDAGWRNATSPLSGFVTVNAFDIAAGITARLRLPWQLELSTDLNMYSRRGYNDASMNTTDWVWNMALQRPFAKGALTVKADAFDILGQLSNVTYSLNSLGRTETRTNSLRRYAMLTIAYRFNLLPKSR